jgi:very-short-patch-repair endonuclease
MRDRSRVGIQRTGADSGTAWRPHPRPGLRADERVALKAAEEWSVLSLDELLECGLSRDAVEVRARNGRLHRMHRGVYAVGHPNPPLEGHFLAAVKACGADAVLSHFSAAAHWGIVDWDDRRLEVTVARPGGRSQPNLRVHRTKMLDRRDMARHRGVRVTSPARTLIDLGSTLREPGLRRAVSRGHSLHLVNVRGLMDVIDRLGRSRRGVRKLVRIVASGPAPTCTDLEDVVLDFLLGNGLAHPHVNRPLIVEGRRVIPDFRWPEQRLIIEADGRAWHDHKIAREDDAERQALLEAHGERVLRVTWHQVLAQPAQTVARIRAAGVPNANGPAYNVAQINPVAG